MLSTKLVYTAEVKLRSVNWTSPQTAVSQLENFLNNASNGTSPQTTVTSKATHKSANRTANAVNWKRELGILY